MADTADQSRASSSPSQAAYDMLTREDDGRVCRDIPEAACNAQAGNFVLHVVSLAATKTGDALVNPKLVLSWLLGALGAPPALVGLLVPVREAGALLPQLVIAARVRAMPRRKWVWAAGSALQGAAVLGMAAVAFLLEGAVAGWAIVGLLAVFALARSACSVSYKDVLGKTVSKTTRGTATGTASTIAAGAALLFGAVLSTGWFDITVGVIGAALLTAGGLWLGAAAVFARVHETPGATEGGGNPMQVTLTNLPLLWRDAELRHFILTRALLLPTALAPPYLLAAAGRDGGTTLGTLGPFVLAAGLAGLGSTYVWGRLADRSSRKVLLLAGLVGASALAAAATVVALAGEGGGRLWAWLPVFLVLMVAYEGVRLGRSTHIVDMADADQRAIYTALSNTSVGVLLVAAGLFGLLASVAGLVAVFGVFAGLCLGASVAASRLSEVQAG